MMKINKIEIEGEEVFMKKSKLGWRVIKPWKNEDGTINWFNFLTGGSWFNLFVVTIIVVVTLGVLYEYSANMKTLLGCFDSQTTLEVCKRSFMIQPRIIIFP